MKWTKEEDKLLLEEFNNKKTYKEINILLKNRTERAIRARLNRFGYKTSDVYEKKFDDCTCKTCGDSFLKKQSQIKKTKNNFCSRSCAARFNGLNLARNVKGVNGSVKIKKVDKFCLNCGKKIKKYTYCNNTCSAEYKKKQIFIKIENCEFSFKNIEKWIKLYLIHKYGEKCMECGWNKKHTITGKVPIQMNHKDGNSENNSLDNLELLCPNCHSLTENYGALNNGNGRTKRKEYRNKQKKKMGFYI